MRVTEKTPVDIKSMQGPQVNPYTSQDRGEAKNIREDMAPWQIKTEKVTQGDVTNAVDKINRTVRIFNRAIHFSKHEESGRMWVQVIDTETQKVVREIPPEEILEIVARLEEMVGLLIDERR
ncbi:MAG: flagellar protein FlaG [Bacillota bacterium]